MTPHVTDLGIAAYLWFVACISLLVCLVPVLREINRAREHDDRLARAQEADDWDEPVREDVESAMSETPIYDALSQEQFVADALDEIEQMTGGGMSEQSAEKDEIDTELERCDGSMSCPARRHPPTCSFRRWQDREVEREVERRKGVHW